MEKKREVHAPDVDVHMTGGVSEGDGDGEEEVGDVAVEEDGEDDDGHGDGEEEAGDVAVEEDGEDDDEHGHGEEEPDESKEKSPQIQASGDEDVEMKDVNPPVTDPRVSFCDICFLMRGSTSAHARYTSSL